MDEKEKPGIVQKPVSFFRHGPPPKHRYLYPRITWAAPLPPVKYKCPLSGLYPGAVPLWLPPLLALLPAHLQGFAATLGYQGFCGELLASLGRQAYGGEAEAFAYEVLLLAGLVLQGGLGYTLLFLLLALPEAVRDRLGKGLGHLAGLTALYLVLVYAATRTWGLLLPTPYGWAWGGPAPWDGLGVFLALWQGLVFWAFWKGWGR